MTRPGFPHLLPHTITLAVGPLGGTNIRLTAQLEFAFHSSQPLITLAMHALSDHLRSPRDDTSP